MPDWSEFEKLSGENDLNFENLCKGLIILHYERFGRITALSSQAGVEFYIELHHDCVLGKTGQTIGWQCKWYDKLSRARAIGNARQKKIADGISKTIKHYPNIDRWVLWTKYNLTSGDHTWYKKQTSSMILDHKHEDYVDLLLHGDGSLLRESYFGDLIMSRSWLNQTHDLSTSQVQHRWLTHLHQVSQAEKKIRKHLCEPSSWKELSELRFTIEDYRNKVREVENQLPDEIQKSLLIWHDEVDFFVSLFERQFNALNRGCLKGVTSVINELRQPCSEIAVIPRRLRAAKSPLGMYTTNIKAFIQDGIRMLKSIEVGVSTRIVAVIADAGGGKTQLAAEISARTDARSAGLLLLGKHLNQGDSIDQLVQRISLNGKPLQNIESLVAGLNSEGERQQSRLPLIIDGLNESERPSDWKDILSQLYELLKNYPYVLVICTVRSGIRKGLSGRGLDHHFSDRDSLEKSRLDFAEQSLPEPLFNSRLEMNAFDSDPDGAIDAYLKEYKIDIGNNALPWVIKSHPLSLRIFCEACNPTKETVKIVESIPQSMFLVFNEYVENTSTRICELSKSSISVDEVKHALFYIGNELWQNGKREVDADALRNEIGDISRNWLDSILPLMEQEGLILINPGDTPYKKEVSPSFDALGGYYIANSLFQRRLSNDDLTHWLKDSQNIKKLNRESDFSLKDDVFRMLVNVIPYKFHGTHMWKICDEEIKVEALLRCLDVEPQYLDEETMDAVLERIIAGEAKPDYIFYKFQHLGLSPAHPFNYSFLDKVLTGMSVSNRDLYWSRWLQKHYKRLYSYNERYFELQDELQIITDHWKNNAERNQVDRLQLYRLKWFLTTNIHSFRDKTTYAIYLYGIHSSGYLYEETIKSLHINDPSVIERLLAACAGVLMYRHGNFATDTSDEYFANELHKKILTAEDKFHTTHILSVEYLKIIFKLGFKNHATKLEEVLGVLNNLNDEYRSIPLDWDNVYFSCDKIDEVGSSPFHLNFENYTLGGLVDDRANYDDEHEGYKKVRDLIRWRVAHLGWNSEQFKEIDRKISNDFHRNQTDFKIDRFGKKYSMIAYYELLGWRRRLGLKKISEWEDGRTSEVDIDPSFPIESKKLNLITDDFLWDTKATIEDWLEKGPTPNISNYLELSNLTDEEHEWILLDGYFTQQDEKRGRRLFCFIRTFLVKSSDKELVTELLEKQDIGNRWLPEKMKSHYLYTGEIPWGLSSDYDGKTSLSFATGRRTIQKEVDVDIYYIDGVETNEKELMKYFDSNLEAIKNGVVLEQELTTKSRKEMRDVVTYDDISFDVVVPVFDIGWEGRSIEEKTLNHISLSKDIAIELDLRTIPNSSDLQNCLGERVSHNISYGEHYKDFQQYYYFRKDLISEYLKKNDLSLITVQWGERELSNGALKNKNYRPQPGEILHKDFKKVYI